MKKELVLAWLREKVANVMPVEDPAEVQLGAP
jgi:hypothetical protein